MKSLFIGLIALFCMAAVNQLSAQIQKNGSITMSHQMPDGTNIELKGISIKGSHAGGMTTQSVSNVVPTLISLTPNKARRGETFELVIAGQNFDLGGVRVFWSCPFTTISAVLDSEVQLRATLSISNVARMGECLIAAANGLTGPATISNALTFTVLNSGNLSTPITRSVTQITPFSALVTGEVIDGENVFLATVNYSTTGSGGGLVVPLNGLGQFTRTIEALVPNSLYQVYVTSQNPAGVATGNTIQFITPSAAPQLELITKTSGERGKSIDVEIFGTYLFPPNSINVSGEGVSVSLISSSGNTSYSIRVSVEENAPLGQRTLTVTTVYGTSNALPFTVVESTTPKPTLTSVTPNQGLRGVAIPVTLAGTNFSQQSQVALSGTGVSVSQVSVASPTQITALFTISADAALGSRQVSVSNSGGTSESIPFTVTQVTNPEPVLTTVNPSQIEQGKSAVVTLSGSNFLPSSTVLISGSGVTVSNLEYKGSDELTVTLTATPNAAIGSRNLSVFNPTPGGGFSSPVTVNVIAQFVNKAPRINPPPSSIAFLHTAGLQTLQLTGINAGEGESQQLSVTAWVDDTQIIPIVQVNYTNPSETATIQFVNDRTKVGSTTLNVLIKDDGGRANGGVDSLQLAIPLVTLLDTSDDGDSDGAIPTSFALHQNYPNPFNPTTVIPYDLASTGRVRITVYDVTGRMAASLLDAKQNAGRHQVAFDAAGLPSGVYMVRLEAGGELHTRKLTLIK